MIIALDRRGFPIEKIRGHSVVNLIRLFLHCDLIKTWKQRGRWQPVRYKGKRMLVDTWCREDFTIPLPMKGGE